MWSGCIPVFIIGLLSQASAQVCNGVQEFTLNGETGSLAVNANYRNGMACYWKITAATNKIVRLTFNSLSLSVEPYCGADIINVYDSDGALLRDFCGVWRNPPTIVSSSYTMYVLFTSDGTSSSGQGFRATWTTDTFSRVNCQREASLTGSSGVLESSPVKGLNYGNSASCRWSINVWPSQTITLTFEELDLEPQWDCKTDKVEVFDQNNQLIATRCSNRDSSPVISRSSRMFVRFTTDNKSVRGGFRARFEGDIVITTTTTTVATTTTTISGPGPGVIPNVPAENICNSNLYKRLASSTGALGTPSSGYNKNQYCVWDLLVEYPMVVVLELRRFNVQTSPDCTTDYLEVVDIRNTRLRKICGNVSPLPKITSGTYWMRLLFRSDNSGSAPGLTATWSSQPSNMASCSGIQTLTGSTGVVTNSPNDVNYANRANCRWRISVQSSMKIELTFTRFDLEESVRCLKDSVKIYDGFSAGDRLIESICYSKRDSPIIFTSSGNYMHIVFISDNSNVGSGFRGTYRSVRTGGPPVGPPGTITTTSPPPTCGLRDISRILNGNEARPHSWPWMASLRLNNGRRHLCGGSLIDRNWVITAAHCVSYWTNTGRYSVVLGAHDLRNTGVAHSISSVYQHPNYMEQVDPADQTTFYINDIALIRLSQPANLSLSIRPICLPTTDLPLNSDCSVTGWGELTINDVSRDFSDTLLETRAPIAHPFYCSSHSVHGYKYRDDTMLCAGFLDGFSGACKGDSGGPLACGDTEQRFSLQGIITFNTGCKSYGVFTRTTRYLSWIRETMNPAP